MADYKIVNRRRQHRYSSVSGVVPTTPGTGTTSLYYPDSTWVNTDIMVSEIFTNSADARVWFRSDSGIHELGYSGQTGNFVSLGDTPSSYTGYAGSWLRVNTGETGLEFFDYSGFSYSIAGCVDFLYTGMTSADDGKSITWDLANTGFTLTSIQNTFVALNDVDNTGYTSANDLLRINSGVDGLEFFTGTDTYVDLGTVQTIASAKTFSDTITFDNGINVSYPFIFTGQTGTYVINDIATSTGSTANNNSIPTWLLVKDYIDLQNFTTGGTASFVTLDTTQTISGVKTFSAHQNFSTLSATTIVTDDIYNDNQFINIAGVQYWGDATTNGSYRKYLNINGIYQIDKREGGVWQFHASF